MKTSNPAFSRGAFETVSRDSFDRMTVGGAVNRSFALLGMLLLSALWAWNKIFTAPSMIDGAPSIPVWFFPIFIAGFVLSLVIIFKKNTAPYLAPLYALAEGTLLGTLSAMTELSYPGIALQATLLTVGILLAMLTAYRTGLIVVTQKFRTGVFAATGGIALAYLFDFILRMFGIHVPFIHESGSLGLLVSAVIVVVAALNLVLDFDFFEKGAAAGLPRYMEWYAAFGLMVTLVWLYLEVLRLLSKARSRD